MLRHTKEVTMLVAFIVLAVVSGVAIWLTERVDRPVRRALRQAQQEVQPAE